jgi:nitroreductase
VSSSDPPLSASPQRVDHLVVQTILGRRAARGQFTGHPIPTAVLIEIVRCGLAAPSSKNAQPWRLHIVSEPTMLEAIASAVETSKGAESYVPSDPLTDRPRPDWPSTVVASADVLRRASTAIFVENRGSFSRGRRILTEAIQAGRVKSLEGYSFEILGIGAAIQNMWIAAEAFGVRGRFMGDVVIAEEEIARRLGIETDLMGVLALGYVEASTPSTIPQTALTDRTRVVWHGTTGPGSTVGGT